MCCHCRISPNRIVRVIYYNYPPGRNYSLYLSVWMSAGYLTCFYWVGQCFVKNIFKPWNTNFYGIWIYLSQKTLQMHCILIRDIWKSGKKGRPLLLFPNPPYGNDKSVLRPCIGNGHSFFTTSHIWDSLKVVLGANDEDFKHTPAAKLRGSF